MGVEVGKPQLIELLAFVGIVEIQHTAGVATRPVEVGDKFEEFLGGEHGAFVGMYHPLDVEVDIEAGAVGAVPVFADVRVAEDDAVHDDAGVAFANANHIEAVAFENACVFVDAPVELEDFEMFHAVEIIIHCE